MGIMGSFKFKKSCKKQCSERFSIVRFLKYINNKIEKDLANFIINFIISKVASCIERMLRLSLFSYLQFWLNLLMDGWLLFLTSTTSHPQHHKSSKERKNNKHIHTSIQSSQGTWLFIQISSSFSSIHSSGITFGIFMDVIFFLEKRSDP